MMGTGMLKLIPRGSRTVPSATAADNKKRNHVLNSPTDAISSPSRSTGRLMHRDNVAMVREKKIVVSSDHNKSLKCSIASGASSTVGSPIRQPDLADPSMCTSSSSKASKNIVDQGKRLKLMRSSDRPSKVLANQPVDKPTPAPASSTILRRSSITRTPLQAGVKPDRGRNIANADLRCISKAVDMVQNADSTDHGRKSDPISNSTTSDCPLCNDITTVLKGESKQTDHDSSVRSDDIHGVLDMEINADDEGRNGRIVELDLSASNAAGSKAPQGKSSLGSTDPKAKSRQIKETSVKTDVKKEESGLSKKIFSNWRNADQKRPCKINVLGGINPGSHCDAPKATGATRLGHDEIPVKTIAKPKSGESHSKYNTKALTMKDHGRAFRHINHNNFQLGSSAQDIIMISESSRTNDGKLRLRSMHGTCKYTDPQDLVDQSICLADVSEEHQKVLDDHDRRLTSSNINEEFVTSSNYKCLPSMNRENWPVGPLYYCSPPPSSLPFPKFSIPNMLKESHSLRRSEHVLVDGYSTLPLVPMIEQQIRKKSPSTNIDRPVNHAPPVSSYDVMATKGLRRMLNLDP